MYDVIFSKSTADRPIVVSAHTAYWPVDLGQSIHNSDFMHCALKIISWFSVIIQTPWSTWSKYRSKVDWKSSIRSQNVHFPKTQGALPLVGYTSVTRRLHVCYVGYRRNRHQHVGYTSVTRRLHVGYVGYDYDILAAWIFGKWTFWDRMLEICYSRTSYQRPAALLWLHEIYSSSVSCQTSGFAVTPRTTAGLVGWACPLKNRCHQ